jgi:hypothetical protein
MNFIQVHNVLSAHPDVTNMRPVGLHRWQFLLEFETYHSDGGGYQNAVLEVHSSPGVTILYYLGDDVCGYEQSAEQCSDRERLILAGSFSPESLFNALRQLVKSACKYTRSDGSQEFLVGDERLCRAYTAVFDNVCVSEKRI